MGIGLKRRIRPLITFIERFNPFRMQREIDVLYALLFRMAHDKERASLLTELQTQEAFRHQWETHKKGQFLLSDPWFKENVADILARQELRLEPGWFAGKSVLDVGCGNGRWAYGFSRLGAHVTAVDANQVALDETRKALKPFSLKKGFYCSKVEDMSENLPDKRYDLVFSWGVLHHCGRFNAALEQAAHFVKEGGILYLYLYGRESLSIEQDLALFKRRLQYNTLPDEEARQQFLLQAAGGDPGRIHNLHDEFAPLINRRLTYEEVHEHLQALGFVDIMRTVEHHTELFIRACKGHVPADLQAATLPAHDPPYWFQHYG